VGSPSSDKLYTDHLIPTYIFTVVEPLVAITCACAPFYLHVGQAIGAVGSSLRSLLTSSRPSGFKMSDQDNLSIPSTIGSSKRKLWAANMQPADHPLPKLNHVATVVDDQPEVQEYPRAGQIYMTSRIHQEEKNHAGRGDDIV
jgi:hypothetical protein